MAEPFFKQAVDPISRFLFDNDLRSDDLTAVELIGGGSRVPKIQSLLADTVGNSSLIGSHINGDEAMVLGAAFYGANSSKKFKVKGVNLYDGYNFEMRLVLKNSEEGIEEGDENYYFKNVTIFKKKARFGATKEVTFKCKENIIA